MTTRILEATCPDCRGPLSETIDDHMNEYRCLVGHAYSGRTLLQAHSETQEKALWAAVVALEEAAIIVRAVGPQFPVDIAARLKAQADGKAAQAKEIRALIEKLEPFQTA